MKHKNYLEYLKNIIDLVPSDIDKPFIQALEEALLPIVKIRWADYEAEEIESYLLSEEDLADSWQKASFIITENALRNLSEFELIKMGVNEDGEIVYSATEKGLEYIKNSE
jgi:hypothetical protein